MSGAEGYPLLRFPKIPNGIEKQARNMVEETLGYFDDLRPYEREREDLARETIHLLIDNGFNLDVNGQRLVAGIAFYYPEALESFEDDPRIVDKDAIFEPLKALAARLPQDALSRWEQDGLIELSEFTRALQSRFQ